MSFRVLGSSDPLIAQVNAGDLEPSCGEYEYGPGHRSYELAKIYIHKGREKEFFEWWNSKSPPGQKLRGSAIDPAACYEEAFRLAKSLQSPEQKTEILVYLADWSLQKRDFLKTQEVVNELPLKRMREPSPEQEGINKIRDNVLKGLLRHNYDEHQFAQAVGNIKRIDDPSDKVEQVYKLVDWHMRHKNPALALETVIATLPNCSFQQGGQCLRIANCFLEDNKPELAIKAARLVDDEVSLSEKNVIIAKIWAYFMTHGMAGEASQLDNERIAEIHSLPLPYSQEMVLSDYAQKKRLHTN